MVPGFWSVNFHSPAFVLVTSFTTVLTQYVEDWPKLIFIKNKKAHDTLLIK
jgi:hypothetical protein